MYTTTYPFILIFMLLLAGCTMHLNDDKTKKKPDQGSTSFNDPPAWAKEVIWYQIFVERFYNGDTANDPTPEDIAGSYPGFVPEGWKITPWTQDWYASDSFFSGLEKQHDFHGNPIKTFDQKVQLRRYGGDLQGVIQKIGYLDSLGISAVYFNPLNDAPSLHKYDARNWRHIDRNFGPSPLRDKKIIEAEVPDDPATWKMTGADSLFLVLIEKLHQKGIRVILDYSWNHTGITFWAWKDVLEKQAESGYANWYWIRQFDEPGTPENEFDYRGWLGVHTLPEIKETVFKDHAEKVEAFDGNIAEEAVKQHIFAVSRRWLDPDNDGDPSDGVDGFRLDVAAEMPLGFWREYRKIVRDVNPDAFLLGEIWWEKFPDQLLDPKPFLEGDIFDAVMNYRWYRAARHFFNQSPDEIRVSEFVDSLKSFASNLRQQTNYAMMNLTASHDVPRVATSLFNTNKYKFNARPSADSAYKIHKPDEKTYQNLKLLLAHQFTYIGAPHIWAGDEMGMWGADDPDTRKPLIWPEFEFEKEKYHPLQLDRPEDEVIFNHELFRYYKKMIKIRTNNPVLAHGVLAYLIVNDEDKVLAYSRFNEAQEIVVVFNTGKMERDIMFLPKTKGTFINAIDNNQLPVKVKDQWKISMEGRTAAILISK